MEGLTIVCDSCEHNWSADHAYSVYEQQALESRPCPNCGACTLTIAEIPETRWSRRCFAAFAFGKAS